MGRQPVTISDKIAHGSVKMLRRIFDFVTGYKNLPIPETVLAENPISKESIDKLRKQGVLLSDKAWLLRVILLESIAGVPGMVGGTLRHLRSLRLLVSPLSHYVQARVLSVATRWRMDTHVVGRSGK